MARRTLIDFFDDLALLDGEFLVYDDGYRTWSLTLRRDGRRRPRVRRPPARGGHRQRPGGRDLEREPARMDRRALGVPARGRHSRPDRLPRVGRLPRPRRGDRQRPRDPRRRGRRYRRADRSRRARSGRCPSSDRSFCTPLFHRSAGTSPGRCQPPGSVNRRLLTADDTAEIIFTSGATADPKGVVITHRNILANIVPIEREIAKIPAVGQAVSPDPVPQPAAAQPHVRTGDGDVRAADAARPRGVHAQLLARRHRPADPRSARVGAGVRAEDPRGPAGPRRARGAGDGRGRRRRCTGRRAGGGIAPCTACSGSSSGRSSSARRRSIPSSRRSGDGWALSSSRVTASPRRRRSSR